LYKADKEMKEAEATLPKKNVKEAISKRIKEKVVEENAL